MTASHIVAITEVSVSGGHVLRRSDRIFLLAVDRPGCTYAQMVERELWKRGWPSVSVVRGGFGAWQAPRMDIRHVRV